jgi:hypothetical protein
MNEPCSGFSVLRLAQLLVDDQLDRPSPAARDSSVGVVIASS